MRKPNLVYILADQLRYQSVGYAGDAHARTPNIDRLRARSLSLDNAVSGHPVCAPYRASLFTGKYTTSTGMVINEIRMNPNHRCFAHVLEENGYETAYIGKWHLYAAHMGDHYDPRNSFVPPGPDRLGFDGTFAAYNFHHNYYGAAAYYHLDTPEKHYCEGYEPDVQTDMAIEQMERLRDRPFALFLSLGTPHDPWVPENVPGPALERFRDAAFALPGNYDERDDPHADAWARLDAAERASLPEWMRVYAAMTANLDDNVGRLMAQIERLGLDEDTIVVFTSDHGEMFGAHGRRAKNIFYEEAVRVPFLLRWGDRLGAGASNGACLNTVDIMPTLLSMMALPIPDDVEGEDLSAALRGEVPGPDGALMMGTGATAIFEDGHEWRAWRTARHTYAVYRDDGSELLFDNAEDPLQMRNLAGLPECEALRADLRARMFERMRRIGDAFDACSDYEANWIEDRVIRRTATLR